ncbi:solute carrier organic anion transporter family member 5A1-like, partial [Limulus polyphemus]|uniref:Solute carrier organic anion transporter family member 5A1-like n=1 Tax=Limulus polyphemus TaxID=6850 RepID=A0ABM1C030_LIMPO
LIHFYSTEFDHFQVNLTADCNLGCQCTPYEIEPVCGRNGITYFSPCHAGCRLDNDRIQGIGIIQNFTSCACIPTNKTILRDVTAVPLATYGSCPQVCKAMIPFMVLLFIMTLVVSIMQMPVLMITLRSVSEEERSFALGMQFVIFRLFGYIPSPIMFGNVIDSTCLVWKAYCGRPSGFCLMHDIEQFRLRYIGVCTGLKVVSGCLFFLDWVLISWKQRKDIEQPVAMTLGELVSSVMSMDRHSAMGDFIHDDVRTGTLRSDEEMQPLEDDHTGLRPGSEQAEGDFIHEDVREGTHHDKEEVQPLEDDHTGLRPGSEQAEGDFIHEDVRVGTRHDKEEVQPLENDHTYSYHNSSNNQAKER